MSEHQDRKRNEDMCERIHKVIDEHLKTQDERIGRHSNRIEKLEQFQAGVTVEIRELCIQIRNLVKTAQWGTGLTVASLLAFFIWYVQRL